jgi:Holliday junction resolvase RusA-like endonuclease
MIEPVTFCLSGPPRGWQRTGGNGRRRFKQAATRAYEGDLATMAMIAMRSRPVITGAVTLDLRAVYPIPASWSAAKRARAITGEIKPTVKPDLDNVIKAVCDAMNGIVLKDDAQIVDYSHCRKVYGVTPMVAVTIKDATA